MNKKLLITIDARMIQASGIGNYLQNLLPFLIGSFKTYLIGDPEQLENYSWAADAVIIPSKVPIYSLKEQVELQKKIPVCDVFWSPHYNIPLLPLKARKRLVTIHDAYHLAYRHTLSVPQKAYATLLFYAATRLSDKVLTVSEFSRSEISRYTRTAAGNITVVYPGIDTSFFKPLEKKQARQLLAPFFPALPAAFILYVGNVKPHKNLSTLIKAYSLLQQEMQLPVGLVVVGKREGFITGDTQLAAELNEDPFLKKNVHFTGFVKEEHLPLIYNSASLFVFPSIYEGFGLPPLEAMACGCPVLASDAASIPEVSGPAALLFNPADARELKEKLCQLLTQDYLRQELSERGQEHVLQFTWQKTADKLIKIIEEL